MRKQLQAYKIESVVSLETVSGTGIWRIVILLFCLAASAFFSACETSFYSVGKIRIRNLADEGVENAKTLAALHENKDKVLSAILISNNLVNILASAITTSLAIQYFGGNTGVALGLATGILTLIILIFGEITPKSLAGRRADSISLSIAKPLYAVTVFFTPLIFILNKITSLFVFLLTGKPDNKAPTFTENDLKAMVTVSHEEGVLNVDEKEMIHNVFEFGDGEIRDIMTPRIHVITIDLDADYNTIKSIFKNSAYSRMPVTKPGADEIVGILNIKDIAFADATGANGGELVGSRADNSERGVKLGSGELVGGASDFSVADYMRPANFVYEFNNIAKVFNEMRRDRISMSVVLDEYGVMAGVITTEDFIEEIVGDINDEYDDAETEVKEIGENKFIVDGSMGLDNFCDVVGVRIESDDFGSIGGFVLGKLEDLPSAGDKVEYENVEFRIESVINNRIETLYVEIKSDDDIGGVGDSDGAGGGSSDDSGADDGAGSASSDDSGSDNGAGSGSDGSGSDDGAGSGNSGGTEGSSYDGASAAYEITNINTHMENLHEA